MKENGSFHTSSTIKGERFSGQETTINGCKVTLNFLPESNGETIDVVKKILLASQQDIPCEADKAG